MKRSDITPNSRAANMASKPIKPTKRRKKMYRAFGFILLAVLVLFVYFKCTPNKPINDNSLPSAAILKLVTDRHDANKIVFTLDFIIFRDSENVETSLNKKHFTIDSLQQRRTWFRFRPIRVSKRKLGKPNLFSALMLMDQSSSIASSDKHGYRLDAAKQFVSRLTADNEVALWRFPAYRTTREGNPNYQMLASLTTDTALLVREIDVLSETIWGATPMYVAQQAAIAYLADSAVKPIRTMLTFTDGHSAGAARLKDTVVNHAIQHGIKLINIGLGKPDTETLLHQAMETDGAYLYAKDSQQLISFYGNLDKLIGNNATYYHTQWEMTSDGNLTKGKLSHNIKVRFPFGQEIEIPFAFIY